MSHGISLTNAKTSNVSKLLPSAVRIIKTLGNDEGKHGEGDAPEAAHQLVSLCVVWQEEECAVVSNHREDGDDLQRTSAKPELRRIPKY